MQMSCLGRKIPPRFSWPVLCLIKYAVIKQFAQVTVDDDDIYSVTNEFLGARTICSLSGGAVSRSECKDEKLGQI